MKYIQFKAGNGKKTFHICMTNAGEHKGMFVYGHAPKSNVPVAYCNGNHPMVWDFVSDSPPKSGRLCSRCRKKYLKDHTEEDLFLEMM